MQHLGQKCIIRVNARLFFYHHKIDQKITFTQKVNEIIIILWCDRVILEVILIIDFMSSCRTLCFQSVLWVKKKRVPSLHYLLSSSRMNQICSKTNGFSMIFTFCIWYDFMLMIVPYIKQATFRPKMCVWRQCTFRIIFCH